MRALLCLLFASAAAAAADGPLRGQATSIDGKPVDLAGYLGKVVLVVNVASRCGYTRQYAQLQGLHERYGAAGLVVLGFPCNQFGRQEPGDDLEIKAFCETTFSVTFPMFSKIEVNGGNACPLYRYLTSDAVPIEDRGPVKWNFEKFLIDRTGKLAARFRSGVSPDAPDVIKAVEAALAETPE